LSSAFWKVRRGVDERFAFRDERFAMSDQRFAIGDEFGDERFAMSFAMSDFAIRDL
jgi:hypothetical protein